MNGKSQSEMVVRVEQLSKKRGDKLVLDDLCFEIPEGQVLGLLGPNGAGKTTAIQILLGLLAADSGGCEIYGESSLQLSLSCRQRIGYLPETDFWDDVSLPVGDLLKFYSHFFEHWDWDWCQQLLDKLQVDKDKEIWQLSKGQQRKAQLLLTLCHRPDLLILDDPAIGLDVTARRDILWITLETAKQEGKTIIFTSHIMQDVERVVDDVIILDQGRVRLRGSLEELKGTTKRIVLQGAGGDSDSLSPIAGELSRRRLGEDMILVTRDFEPALMADLGSRFARVEVEDMNLEDIFCEVVGVLGCTHIE